WTTVVLGALIVIAAGLVAIADSGYGRALLVRFFELIIERPLKVDGDLQAHLFSLDPRVLAEKVTVGNPPWTPPGVALQADRVSLGLRLPGLRRSGGIMSIDMQGATLHLIRDATGRANWQWRDPATKRVHKNSSIVRSLSMLNAQVVLDDARRHLQFVGTVSAWDVGGPGDPTPLRIEGAGQLNGRATTFAISADPLVSASHNFAYHFRFAESSGGSHLQGNGLFPEPFAVAIADATFVATGPDLKDLYFLTGVHLIDTGNYRLSGKVERRGSLTTFSELIATSGTSDVRGRVSTDSSGGRPRFDVDLHSEDLKLADLGLRAAGRAPEPQSALLLSDAMISPNVLHVEGAVAKYHANHLEVGRVTFENVSLAATIGKDALNVAPLAAILSGGRLAARLTLDASKPIPIANVDVSIADADLGKLFKKDADSPPVEGSLQARIRVTGQGRSIHQVAASATGTVSAQMTGGALRKSFAELTDADLRSLGLLLVKDKQDVPIRCALARFKAQDGTLTAQELVADTEPVLITGEGEIHLDSEALDLAIRGNPKSLRLFRLRSPVLIQGTFAHPLIHIPVKHSHFVLADRGRAEDVDCGALLGAKR
ncbi:MAG: AsmA family protein, partial [Steroidobacteraceae bacterium]